jgi:hypothetical protein
MGRLHGRSIKPLFVDPTGESGAVDPVAISPPVSSKWRREQGRPWRVEDEHFSVRSRTHRYVPYSNGEEELYNHTADPHEWHNLAGEPAHDAVAPRGGCRMVSLSKTFRPGGCFNGIAVL